MTPYATGSLTKKGRGGGAATVEDYGTEGQEEGEGTAAVQESDEEEKSDVELDSMIKVHLSDKCRVF